MLKKFTSCLIIVSMMGMQVVPLYAQNANIPDDLKIKKIGIKTADLDLEAIAKKSSNPIGDAWMLWTQYDWTRYGGDIVPGHADRRDPPRSCPVGAP